MFYFIATVLTNVVISAILKLFGRFRIDPLQAIVVNYCVCVVTGCLFTGQMPFNTTTLQAPWLPWTLMMGVAFISIFNLMAYCTKVSGMTTMVLANKLSLVIPVICSLVLYNESAGAFKITGIIMAFPAVYLITRTCEGGEGASRNLLWPALLFVASGSLDTLVNHIQITYLHTNEAQAACTIVCFATAGATGVIILTAMVLMGKTQIKLKNIVAGICVGIPNFFSIFFLVKALHSGVFQSSATIPLLNVSILIATAITAILFFGERAGKWRIAGLILALTAILLIGFGDQ
ncbi:hypothetical protein GCM10023093_01250 [Nemorincola caseinilytica]|uniref:EamA domain-containing protein n=1 Tax=Nemorincola caseinilytica TaxID=2054315 RepID=A0ABP8N5U8_9BACT